MTAGLGVILLFAIIGVVSAGLWIGGKVTGGSHTAVGTVTVVPTSDAAARLNLARAQAQATQIVKTARTKGNSIVGKATTRANREAAAIVTRARQQAASARTQRSSSAPAASPPASTSGSAAGSSPPASSTTGGGSAPSTSAAAPYSAAPYATPAPYPTSVTRPYVAAPTLANSQPASATANLSTLPGSWLVVGYNATFGRGPGSAGSVTVTNRSNKALTGVARVVYKNGAVATARFTTIAPGQTLVLPLNGPAYPGGGYTIQMAGLR